MTALGATQGGWAWPLLLALGVVLLVVGLVLLRRVTPSGDVTGSGSETRPRPGFFASAMMLSLHIQLGRN